MSNVNIIDEFNEKAILNRIPTYCHFDLTYKCNLNCIHCYVVKDKSPELGTNKIKNILKELADSGTFSIFFSGGEVLTREDFFEIAIYARKLNFALNIATNGTLIDEETADKLKALKPLAISISIYSMDPSIHDNITSVPGSLEKTVNAVKMLRKRNLKVNIKCPIMKPNINGYMEVYNFAKEIGANFHIDPQITVKNDGDTSTLDLQINNKDLYKVMSNDILDLENKEEQNIDIPPTLLDDIPCSAGFNLFCISPYGEIFPCVQFPISCGNLNEKSFKEIWYYSPKMLNISSLRISHISKCSHCDIIEYCNLCPGISYLEEDNFRKNSLRKCNEALINKSIKENRKYGK